MRLPLVDGQGNYGSMDGDKAAAMRYTEARMARSAHALLEDIDRDTVDFQPNYDESSREPIVLPAGFPNLLVNGAAGIAVGMATNIPPHNLGEVVSACCAYIDNPDITIDELIADHVQGPDFPTGAQILGKQGIISAYHTGRGSIVIRGKLWGLIACHHNSPRVLSFQARSATQMFGQLFALILEKKDNELSNLDRERAQSLHDALMARLATGSSIARQFQDLADMISQVIP